MENLEKTTNYVPQENLSEEEKEKLSQTEEQTEEIFKFRSRLGLELNRFRKLKKEGEAPDKIIKLGKEKN